jgi:hypothetical protein
VLVLVPVLVLVLMLVLEMKEEVILLWLQVLRRRII